MTSIQIAPSIVRTERGLSLQDTRITLYDIFEYLSMDWPPSLIQQWLNISEQQMADALSYIAEHRKDVENEYQDIIRQAATNRHYWEIRNRERFRQIAELPPKPGFEAAYEKLQARKAERERT